MGRESGGTASVHAGTSAAPAPSSRSPFRQVVSALLRDRLALIGLVVVAAFVLAAALAPVIAPQNPYDLSQLDVLDSRLPPGSRSVSGLLYLMGTDGQGRDLLCAILYGLRTSLLVGLSSAAVALVIGAAIGLLSAYAGGRVDAVLMRIVDIQLSFPAILIALIFLAVLGQGIDKIILALIVTQWAYYARTIRGSALVERKRAYVDASWPRCVSPMRSCWRQRCPSSASACPSRSRRSAS